MDHWLSVLASAVVFASLMVGYRIVGRKLAGPMMAREAVRERDYYRNSYGENSFAKGAWDDLIETHVLKYGVVIRRAWPYALLGYYLDRQAATAKAELKEQWTAHDPVRQERELEARERAVERAEAEVAARERQLGVGDRL